LRSQRRPGTPSSCGAPLVPRTGASTYPESHRKRKPPMQISLAGKTALVTGSTSGIGLAIAKGLAAAGAETIVNGREQGKVDRVVANLKRALPDATVYGVAGDVGEAAGCEALVQAVPAIDILVNNAGIFEPKDFFAIPDGDWTRMMEVN